MLTCLFLLSTLMSDVADNSVKNPDIAKHEEMLNRIKSIHIKMQMFHQYPEEDLKKCFEFECWKSGNKHKGKILNFMNFKKGGSAYYDEEENAQLYVYSKNGQEQRSYRSLDEMMRFTGFIRLSGPVPEFSWHKWFYILHHSRENIWTLNNPLSPVFKKAEYEKLPSKDNGIVRYKAKRHIFPFMIGSVIELDISRGGSLKKITYANGWEATVESYLEFPNKIWIPSRIVSRDKKGKGRTTVSKLIECEINEPIAEKNLIAKFPEGIVVRNSISKKKVIWGDGEAARAHHFVDDLGNGLKEVMRRAILISTGYDIKESKRDSRLVWWACGGLMLVFIALYFIRRRIIKKRIAAKSR